MSGRLPMKAPPNQRLHRTASQRRLLRSGLHAAGESQRSASSLRSRRGAKICGMNTEVETQVITRSPDVMSGTPVFAGTRVPVQTIIDYLAGGHSLDEFLDDFPTVRREQALELLHQIKQMLVGAPA